jgi:O-antigen/teichoic acid export membrane protein
MLGVAVTAPVVMLTNIQLRSVQASSGASEFGFGHYLALRILSGCSALGVIGIVVMVGGYSRATAAVVFAVGVAKVIESLGDVCYGLQQRAERMSQVAVSLMLRGAASVLVVGTVLFVTGNVLHGVVALALAWGVVLLVYDLPNASLLLQDRAETISPAWNPSALWRLVRLAAPLGVVSFLMSLNTNIPRYLVHLQLGERELGIFAAMAYLTAVGATVVSALGQATLPRLATLHIEGRRRSFVQLLGKMAAVIVGIALLGFGAAAAAGEPLIRLVYGAAYAEYAFLLVPVIAWTAVSFLTSILTFAATAVRQFDIQMPISVLAITVTGATSAVLIARWGVAGAAWGALAGTAVHALGNLAVVAYALRSRKTAFQPIYLTS